ncbi:PREDICTED: uncharacterized protein LOC109236058 [Nicotiana attenuata]|uniref:uncharacterized protein LOC109236058 n=1 Tax=Nicotiana attenuata TaxID=49451 RepID=UPI000905D175|nr:PREDICTED: uncharacterized protein LOC109236058 [Nicotiana attenuata]
MDNDAVRPGLLSSVLYASSAHKVWEDLKERFDKVNGSRILYLHREVHTLTQGIMTVTDYFSKLRELWDEFDALMPCPGCPCPESKMYAQHFEYQRLLQFLTGLNESYSHSRSQIMMMSPLPSINRAYSVLVDQESERNLVNMPQVAQVSDALENLAMYSNKGTNNTGSYKQKRNQVQCEYCHYKGHSKENCYKFIGYPPDFNSKKKGVNSGQYANQGYSPELNYADRYGMGNNVASNVVQQGRVGNQSNAGALQPQPANQPAFFQQMPLSTPVFTPEQYQQIVHLLSKGSIEGSEALSKSTAAGILNKVNAFMSHCVNDRWIVDTRASNHMTSSLEILHDYKALPNTEENKVQLPTGSVASVSHIGNASVLSNHEISNVLYIPDFKFNLLSVSKLTKELKYMVGFFPDFCIFQDLFSGQVKGIGREEHGLYILRGSTSIANSSQPTNKCANTTNEVLAASASDASMFPPASSTSSRTHVSSICSLWHKRLGHAPIDVIKKIEALNELATGVLSQPCTVCPVAKQTKMPFQLSNTTSKSIFELVHCDIWGPYRVPTHDGKRYFVTIVDDYSRFTWIFLLNCKSEAIVVLRDFLTQVSNVFSTTVKILRTDNGSEFFSTAFKHLLSDLGIVHQSTCVYTPQQNGGECVATAVYLLNRLPSKGFRNYGIPCSGSIIPELNASPISYSIPIVERSTEPAADPVPSDFPAEIPSFSPDRIAPEPIPSTMPSLQDNGCAELSAGQSDLAENLEGCRRSSRPSKPPVWLQDYVTLSKGSKCTYPISSYVDYSHISPTFRQALIAYSAITEPTTFREAAADPRWVKAMQLEIAALEDNSGGFFSMRSRPRGRVREDGWTGSIAFTIVGLRTRREIFLGSGERHPLAVCGVYNVKYKASGEVERFKARLVAKDTMDVHNAFLNGDLIERFICILPEGSKTMEYEIDRGPSVYGVQQSHYDYSLFTKKVGSDIVVILLEHPLELNQKLTTTEFDKCFNTNNTHSDEALKNPGVYQRLVGRLPVSHYDQARYAFVVQVLSQFMHCPKSISYGSSIESNKIRGMHTDKEICYRRIIDSVSGGDPVTLFYSKLVSAAMAAAPSLLALTKMQQI